ncbi:MAG: polysaccharide biosynthesis tyrosine autokinase, partial [Anaerolineae bacterium]|nr:polysaccharide biosynthesis tyrosine autokinase [Anaerolineae bacterium]
EGIDLRQYVAIGLKWWWLIVIGLGLGAAVGFITTTNQPPTYLATTTLIVGPSTQAANLNTTDIRNSAELAWTYTAMAKRQPVLQKVSDQLGLNRDWETLVGQIAVEPVLDTQLLEITAKSTSPDEARAIADEVANQLILLSPSSVHQQQDADSRQFVQQRLSGLQTKIEAGQERLNSLEAAMQGSLSAGEIQEMQREINSLESLVAGWENNYTQLYIFLESGKAPNNLTVFEPAQVKAQTASSSPSRNGLLGGMFGLMAALGLIYLIEYIDDTVQSSEQLTQTLELTSLGRVDQIDGTTARERLIVDHDPFSPVAEEYRIIRSNLQFMSIDHPLKSILITSPSPGEGKSITTANLGIIMAQAGFKTVIVDTDLRRPVQHQLFDVPNQTGLTNLLSSVDTNIDPYLKPTQTKNLYVITSGTMPPNPSELLGSQRMADLIDALRNMADIVLYDSPPVLAVADALVLAHQVDGVALVVQAKKTRLGGARQALMTL